MRILVDFCCLFVCFLERENGAIEKAHKLREGEAEGGRRDWGREEKHGEGKMWKACRAKLLPVWCLASPSSQTHRTQSFSIFKSSMLRPLASLQGEQRCAQNHRRRNSIEPFKPHHNAAKHQKQGEKNPKTQKNLVQLIFLPGCGNRKISLGWGIKQTFLTCRSRLG